MAIILRNAAQSINNFIESAAGSVIGHIHLLGQPLNIASILHQQLYKIKLFSRQASNPAQTESSLDSNATGGAFQARHHEFLATYSVSGYLWIHTCSLYKRLCRKIFPAASRDCHATRI